MIFDGAERSELRNLGFIVRLIRAAIAAVRRFPESGVVEGRFVLCH